METSPILRNAEAKRIAQLLAGAALYGVSVNLFIVPAGLYSGGLVGLSQIVRTLLRTRLGIGGAHDFSGLLNYMLNIPILIAAWRKLNRSFVVRTVLAISAMTALKDDTAKIRQLK